MKKENIRERRLVYIEQVSQEVKQISKKEDWTAIRKMKIGKGVGPDIPVKLWKCLGYLAVNLLSEMFDDLLEGKNAARMEISTLITIFKKRLMCKIAIIIAG